MRLTFTLFILCCCFTGPLTGRHIIGGEITYRILGPGSIDSTLNYEFIMKIYRDCSADGAQFDNPAPIGIYSRIGNVYSFIRRVDAQHSPVEPVPNPENPCLIITDDVCVEEAVYRFRINNLPIINGSYFIHWQRCCRNNSINNIVQPQNTGATYTVEITEDAQRLRNNSPTFNDFPPTAICINEPVSFDHSASDAEGDQLVYEFCAPLEGGGPNGINDQNAARLCDGITPDPAICPPPYTPVTFIAPTYSIINPLSGDPKVGIDPITGMITGTPTIFGQFVVGVCVKEYRNGVLLSVLRRDFQFNVVNCENVVSAGIQSDATVGEKEFVLNSCGVNTINFINTSTIESFIISYRWEFDINGQIETTLTRNATVTFPGVGTYSGVMIINEGLNCADTAFINVNVFPSIEADFEFDYDTCVAGPVSFTDLSSTGALTLTDWNWNFGDGEFSNFRNPDHQYRMPGDIPVQLTVTDNNECQATTEKIVPYFPVPPLIIIEPSTFVGCNPANIFFNNLSTPIDDSYDILWRFGDGNTGGDISPTHVYEDPGIYSISIEITSPIGCFTSASFPNWIRVRPSPVADFTFTPQQPSSFNPVVSFIDQSIDAVAWQWDFNEEATIFMQNPTHTFRDTGVKEVELVVFHENGCTDTANAFIDIIPQVSYFLPNAFTPNEDGKNDEYMGAGITDGIRDFEMKIWARWGELIFETNNASEGWNGRRFNTGEDLPVGVYIATVQYTTPRNERIEIKEFATLVR